MMRSCLVCFIVCVQATCLAAGDKEVEQPEPVVNHEPVAIARVYEKIKEVVPSRPRQYQLLREDEMHFGYLMSDLERLFEGLKKSPEELHFLGHFCATKPERVTKEQVDFCAEVLRVLMVELKKECQQRKCNPNSEFYFCGSGFGF
jgi:hypothetical protein